MARFMFVPLGNPSFLPLTLMRIALGIFFFSSGFNKTFISESQQLMFETISAAGIPNPHIMSILVGGCEAIFGLFLAFGFLTRLSSLALMIISLVALFTVGLYHIPMHLNLLTWYSWFFYLPEPSYILMCIMLVIQGSGPFGIDRLIAKRYIR